MIVDVHTHIGFGGAITASVGDLVASMNQAGIEKALVLAGEMNECPNKKLIAELAPFQNKLFGIGTYTPRVWDDAAIKYAEMQAVEDALRTGTLRGLKFYLGYHHFYPADREIRAWLEMLVRYNRPAIFHTGDCYSKVNGAKLKYAHPLGLDDIAVELPQLKIIMAHCGNPWLIDAAEVCYKNPNVFTDCSGFVCGDFDFEAARRFHTQMHEFIQYMETPEKLLFGSDWPICSQTSYRHTVERLSLGSAALEKIMGDTAAELFGLKD